MSGFQRSFFDEEHQRDLGLKGTSTALALSHEIVSRLVSLRTELASSQPSDPLIAQVRQLQAMMQEVHNELTLRRSQHGQSSH